MSSARIAALAAVVVALPIISGCGDSTKTAATAAQTAGSDSTATTPEAPKPTSSEPLTSEELASKANSICRRVAARRASNRAQTREQVSTVASELGAFEQTIAREMAVLTPPAKLANDWHQILTGVQMLATDTAKVGEYARLNQLQSLVAANLIEERPKLEHQLLAIAEHDGFNDCAKSI